MFALITLALFSIQTEPPTVITLDETVITIYRPAPKARQCETRALIQGSGTVKVCQ